MTSSNARMQKMIEAEQAIDERIQSRDTPQEGAPADEPSDPPVDEPRGDDTPPVEENPTPEPSNEEETWRKRHEALQGKYNAEVPRLAAELRELRGILSDREGTIASLRREIDQMKDQSPKQEPKAEALNEDQIERLRSDYGDDFMEAVRAVALSVVKPSTGSEDLAKKVEQIERETRQQSESRFWADLAAAVPDYQSINADPAFHAWLAETDPVSGHQRQRHLSEAQEGLDAARVARIFKAFSGTTTKASPTPTQQPPPRPVSPGRSRGAERPADTPRYTVEDFVKLQNDIRSGKYRGREAEAEKLEREIHSALFPS